jgi:hypothetical protein|tara:strand:+ start:3184 stop:4317 length:1134 start_codon:yes stop_codon:yes gene_type:complete
MAKYPVEQGDAPGQLDAINYLLSGTQGLGQSVEGFIGNTQLQQNGNNVQPFTATIANLYINVSLATASWLDDNTLRFDFTTPEPVPPFSLGQSLTVSGTSVTEYNTTYTSVVKTTTTYVIVKSMSTIPNMGAAIGGTIEFAAGLTDTVKYLHTDCFGNVNVAGGQDIAVISAQCQTSIQYSTAAVSTLTYTAAINRYKLLSDGSFTFDATVASQSNLLALPSTTTAVTSLSITGGSKPITTYPATYPVTITAAGYNLKLLISINASIAGLYDNTNTTITIVDGGSGWSASDTFTVLGTDIGGTTPADDLTLQVLTVGSLSNNDFVNNTVYFTPVKDAPIPGSYIYFLDTSYYDSSGNTIVLSDTFGYRSLTAQIIKQ